MRELLEQLLRAADIPNAARAEVLWSEYRLGGPSADAAFATLLAWYGLPVYRCIWGFVRSDEAEDVFQDVLAQLHQERQNLTTFEHALRWLYTVAVNRCVDTHRRTTRRRTRETKAAKRHNDQTRPEAELELQEALRVALGKLPKKFRDVVSLVYFAELDHSDAAKLLGINRDTVSARKNEALDRLQKLIPAPVVLAVGTLGVPGVLVARPPALSPHRLSELAAGAWVKAAASAGWSFGKVMAVAGVVLLTGGLALGGWALTSHSKSAPTEPAPTPPARVESPSSEQQPEAFHAKYRRITENELLPKLLEVFRGMAFGDGEVTIGSVEQYDSRLDVTVVFKHRVANNPGWQSRSRFLYDLHTRRILVFFDYEGTGQFRPVNLDQPIILMRDPLFGKTISMSFVPLTRAAEVFASLPTDERAAAEAEGYKNRLRAEFAKYVGTWYRQGDPKRVCKIDFPATGPRVLNEGGYGVEGFERFRFTLNGEIRGVVDHSGEVVFSADRIEFLPTGDWWSRKPGS